MEEEAEKTAQIPSLVLEQLNGQKNGTQVNMDNVPNFTERPKKADIDIELQAATKPFHDAVDEEKRRSEKLLKDLGLSPINPNNS